MSIDVNKPVENPKLVSLLHEIKNTPKEGLGAIYESIAEEIATKAYMLAVMNVDGEIRHNNDGTAVFTKDTVLSFEFFSAGDGVHFLPVFTDWGELRKWDKYKEGPVETLILSFDDMSAITAGKSGIVVNPFSDNFVITPSNVIHMKEHKDIVSKGYSERKVEKDTTVQLGDPSPYPTAMVEAIKKHASKIDAIRAIWLKLMIKDSEKSFLIVVDADVDPRSFFDGIGRTASPFLDKGMYLDMIPYADKFGQQAATGEPFYRKSKKLFNLFNR